MANAPFQWDTRRTQIMGVLNITPDSFSDGGEFLDPKCALARARCLLAAGADILDIGGESTRPGAAPVSAEEELQRVLPVIKALRKSDRQPDLGGRAFRISVDTTKADVAEQALAAGANIVNDISALRRDPRMASVVAEWGAGVVLMHMRGTPQTMQQDPRYGDVGAEVREFLGEQVAIAVSRGILKSQIAVDPGIGFGKTVEHNLQLLAHLRKLQLWGCAIVVGTSRKSFIGKLLDRDTPDRIWGTAATVAWAVAQGAHVIRVHDVREMADVIRMTEAIVKQGGME